MNAPEWLNTAAIVGLIVLVFGLVVGFGGIKVMNKQNQGRGGVSDALDWVFVALIVGTVMALFLGGAWYAISKGFIDFATN